MIPPGQDTFYVQWNCSRECTKHVAQPIHLLGLNFHMHIIGNKHVGGWHLKDLGSFNGYAI